MSTTGTKDFEREIKQIMFDRISIISEELREKGMRWGDMFTEEDNRAIETFTIETIGESVEEAAEREERKRELDRKRRSNLSQAQTPGSVSSEESEIVPDDPIPQSAVSCKNQEKVTTNIPEDEPTPGPSKAKIHEDFVQRQYRRHDFSSGSARQLITQYHRGGTWRPNRVYHTSMDDAWRSKNENPMNRNWRRSYYERGGWKERGRRHFHGRPRWSDERYLHPRGSQEQSDRAHVSYSAEKNSLFCSYQESGQASWHRT